MTALAFLEFREHSNDSNDYLGLAFGAIAAVLAVVSYAYARSDRKRPEEAPPPGASKSPSPPHG